MDLRSHGYLFAISSDRTPRALPRGCGQVRWVSHQQGGNRSGNGFTGLIGVFGNRRHNSPRVIGMAVGQGGERATSVLSIITRSQFAKTIEEWRFRLFASGRSGESRHSPTCVRLSVITNSYRTSTLFCILYLPGGHSGFSSGHRGDDRCKRIPIDVHRGRSNWHLLSAISNILYRSRWPVKITM